MFTASSQGVVPSQETNFFAHLEEAISRPLKFYYEIAAIRFHSQAPLLILVVLLLTADSTTSAVTSSTDVLDPLNPSMKVGINFFQTPVNVDISTSSHQSQTSLMAFKDCF